MQMRTYSLFFSTLTFSCVFQRFVSSQAENIFTFDEEDIILEDPSCPCLGELTHVSTAKMMNDTCLDARIVSTSTGIESSFCYPLSYGTTCKRHGVDLEPFCKKDTDEMPDFCGAPFCYVDPNVCKSSVTSSFRRSNFFPHLFFSFTTCGSADIFEESMHIEQMEGAILRVGVPALFYPDHYRLDTNGEPILFNNDINAGVGELKGIYIEYLNEVAFEGQFKVEYTSVSQGSINENNGDRWEACVFDVSRGLLDMCAGNFKETSPRRKVAQFSTTIQNDIFYMVVPRPEIKDGPSIQMRKLFDPFSFELWITIIVVTIVVGISYTILGIDSTTSFREFRTNMIESIYKASLEVMQGADPTEKRSLAQRSVTVTWAFFILIIIAAYTANLAAFLSQEKTFFGLKTVENCVAKNCNMCSIDSTVLRTQMKQKYPSLRLTSKYNSPGLMMADLKAGICDAAIVSEFDWQLNEDWSGECENTFIGDLVLFFKIAFPVSLTISKTISYWIGKTEENGVFKNIVDQYKPSRQCQQFMELDTTADQIGVMPMLGPLVILAGGIGLGFLVKFGKFLNRERLRRKINKEHLNLMHDKQENVRDVVADSEVWPLPRQLLAEKQEKVRQLLANSDLSLPHRQINSVGV